MLLKELLNLFEAQLETITVEDYWDQHESSSKEYVSSKMYLVRDGDKPGHVEVYQDVNGKRQGPQILTKRQLNASFNLIRPNQRADAEGLSFYQQTGTIDAVKHTGAPVKIQNGDSEVVLKKNDYVTRNFVKTAYSYSVEKSAQFENSFSKK